MTDTPNEAFESAVWPLVALLGQLKGLILQLNDQQYAAANVCAVEGTIGAHVRHCLDHVRTLAKGRTNRQLDYDSRERGTDVETSRLAAVRTIDVLLNDVKNWADAPIDTPLTLSTMLDADRPAVNVPTSFGRELSFVISHTVHHNAMIGAIARAQGAELPARFGYAPSTIAFQNQSQCVR